MLLLWPNLIVLSWTARVVHVRQKRRGAKQNEMGGAVLCCANNSCRLDPSTFVDNLRGLELWWNIAMVRLGG